MLPLISFFAEFLHFCCQLPLSTLSSFTGTCHYEETRKSEEYPLCTCTPALESTRASSTRDKLSRPACCLDIGLRPNDFTCFFLDFQVGKPGVELAKVKEIAAPHPRFVCSR